jgi:hypothetical protein
MLLMAFAPAYALVSLPPTGQGGSIYSGSSNVLGPTIEFAVFDTQSVDYEGLNGVQPEGDGRFMYAYQVFNDYYSDAIPYFNIYGIGEGAVDSNEDIGTADDPGGIDATSAYFNSDFSKGTWTFEDGTLVFDENSVFLILFSNSSWVAGSYDFAVDDDVPVPDAGEPSGNDDNTTIPEPATLLLLAAGSWLVRRRKG